MGIQSLSRITRRSALQGAGVTALGITGAALLGCRGEAPKQGTDGGGAGAPVTEQTGVETLPLVAPVAKGTPRKGGTYTLGATSTFTQHDSHTQLGSSEWHVISEKLTEAHPLDAKTLPHVATSWEIADPKGLTLVFKIKPGIKIHNKPPWNGREFDAQDVAWNLERMGGLYAERLKIPLSAFQRAAMVQNIVKAEATDRHTVKVTLSAPNSGFFNGVSENRTVMMPKEMDDIGYNDPMKFGGIGAFQITEFLKDQRINFKRFDQYFRPGEPSFDDTVYQVVPDRAATIASFGSGQIHLVGGLVEDEINTVRRIKPDSLLYTWIDSNWNHIRPNMRFGPFRDLRVRKAIHLAIDYPEIGNRLYGSGWGYQAALNPGFQEAWKPGKVRALPGYNPETKEQDRAEAAKLLEAAGHPNGKGIDFEIYFSAIINTLSENATRFQGQMKTVFPEMNPTLKTAPDFATYAKQQASQDFDVVSYVITAVPDAVAEMTSQYYTNGSRNYGGFSEPGLDQLLDKALAELDVDARTELMEEFQQKWFDDWRPMFVLHANAARTMIPDNIGGFDKLAGTWYGYSTLTKINRLTFLDK